MYGLQSRIVGSETKDSTLTGHSKTRKRDKHQVSLPVALVVVCNKVAEAGRAFELAPLPFRGMGAAPCTRSDLVLPRLVMVLA